MNPTFIGCRSDLNILLDKSNLKLSRKQKVEVGDFLAKHIEYTKVKAYQMGIESVEYKNNIG